MKMSGVFAAMVLLTAPGVDAAEPEQQGAKQEKKICRTDKATGSLTRRTRICMTAEQWRDFNARTRRGLEEMASGASGGKECLLDQAGGCQVGGFPPAPAVPPGAF